uniref:COPI coat complex subunit gamma 1 n=1 Tax=Rousettus aegyptiacus TaxID=9407 RepID=A0A7J8DG43_ROUAE|nr:COPI coat complex subunit gamma 1 [Rousettus aegyptiacus]
MLKKFDKKDEESGGGSNPFQHLEKSAVLQEARVFNETPINPRKCAHILTKILYLINQGEHLGTTEATEAFFAMTKLFQSNDPTLRRMCYLTIKEMSCIAEDVIIVTSSLTKDMTGKEDNYRGPAVRTLCQITDTRILHLLGQEGPKTNNPSKYIRFIYNRVVLEHEEVRAGAVSALAKFGAQNEEMLPSILVLLKRCVMDDDNEVRDRATFYLNVLEQKQKALNAGYILNGLTVSIPGLERALQQYTLEPSEKPFDLKSVPLATTPMAEQRTESTPIPATKQPEKVATTRQEIFQEQLAAVPEFHGLGPLFKSSPEPVALTESETEYVIHCTKHTFTDHMVFQFDCTNTLNDQTLEHVTVQMDPTEAYEVLCYVPAQSLPYNQPGTCYTLVALPKEDPTAVSCTFSCIMKFTVKDCDPTTGETDDEGYEDEYVLEDLEVTIADHIQKVMKLNFEAAWDEVGEEFEKEETFTLSTIKTLEEAVGNIVKFLGMHPCERSDKVPDNKNTHMLLLAGVFRGGHDILVRSRLLLLDTVTMQVTARSSEELPVDIILASVG